MPFPISSGKKLPIQEEIVLHLLSANKYSMTSVQKLFKKEQSKVRSENNQNSKNKMNMCQNSTLNFYKQILPFWI